MKLYKFAEEEQVKVLPGTGKGVTMLVTRYWVETEIKDIHELNQMAFGDQTREVTPNKVPETYNLQPR